MKFFNWMQSKFSARDGDKRGNALPPTYQKNINGLLLAIGTLGYKDDTILQLQHETFELVEQSLDTEIPRNELECSSPDFSDEQVRRLEKELSKLLRQKPAAKVEENTMCSDLPLDKFLNCPSSLDEVDEAGDIDRTIRIILGRCKDANEKKEKRKPLCFLIKKMFVCGSGIYSTPPSLRDASQESRLEKLMRAMLRKKIHPRNSKGASSSTKKSIQNEDKILQERNDVVVGGIKWDKTDSEFIVLDIN